MVQHTTVNIDTAGATTFNGAIASTQASITESWYHTMTIRKLVSDSVITVAASGTLTSESGATITVSRMWILSHSALHLQRRSSNRCYLLHRQITAAGNTLLKAAITGDRNVGVTTTGSSPVNWYISFNTYNMK